MRKLKKKRQNPSFPKKKIIIFLGSLLVTGILGSIFLLYGPSPKFRNWLVITAMTTMNHQYLATMFYSVKQSKKF